MPTKHTADLPAAADALASCRRGLSEALRDARTAAGALTGARATRAEQLADQIEQAISWCDRIAFYVQCDATSAGLQVSR
jgi:hypothetical protein